MSDPRTESLERLEETLTAGSPLWEWAYDAIRHRAGEMLKHLPGVRAGEDIEAVHDMRVGSRRLVAAFRVFAPCFPTTGYRRLQREARDVTRRLGAVRDLEVLLDYYARLKREALSEEVLGIEYLRVVLARDRDRARKPMLKALEELDRSDYPTRVLDYLQKLGKGLLKDTERDSASTTWQPFADAAPCFLEERFQQLLEFEEYVEYPEKETELHDMRIAAKWLRYTMELFAPAYEGRLKPEISMVKRLQEELGELHDSDVRRALLAETRSRPLGVRGLEALKLFLPDPVEESLDRLREREERRRQELYELFRNDWRKLRRKGKLDRCQVRLSQPDAPRGVHIPAAD